MGPMRGEGTKIRASGFTLIELLIVISIIAFLIVILIVVVRPPRELQSVQAVRQLRESLEAYAQVFEGIYPPSDFSDLKGAQSLYFHLMGPEERGWGPAANRGKIHSRYIWEPPEIRQEWIGGGPDTDVSAKYFTDDAEGSKAILYYRADTSELKPGVPRVAYTDVYSMGDNSDSGQKVFWSPAADDWEALIVNPGGRNQAPYCPESYILISAGVDRIFGFVEGRTDDITNFNVGK